MTIDLSFFSLICLQILLIRDKNYVASAEDLVDYRVPKINRQLEDEYLEYEALEECPEDMLNGSRLYRKEYAEKIFTSIYDWAYDDDILTEEEIEDDLPFDILPADVQKTFLQVVCDYDDECETISDLATSQLYIPFGSIKSNEGEEKASEIAVDLCSSAATEFDDIFNLVRDRVTLKIESNIDEGVDEIEEALPTLSPDSSKDDFENLDSIIVPSEPHEEPKSEVGGSQSEILVLSLRFSIRASGTDLYHQELIKIGKGIESELERKTLEALSSEEQRALTSNHGRKLASFVNSKVRSLETILCDPPPIEGEEITCFLVDAAIYVDPEGDSPAIVIRKVRDAVDDGETPGAYFPQVPGLVEINPLSYLPPSEKNANSTKIIIAGLCVSALLIILFLGFKCNSYHRKKKEAEHVMNEIPRKRSMSEISAEKEKSLVLYGSAFESKKNRGLSGMTTIKEHANHPPTLISPLTAGTKTDDGDSFDSAPDLESSPYNYKYCQPCTKSIAPPTPGNRYIPEKENKSQSQIPEEPDENVELVLSPVNTSVEETEKGFVKYISPLSLNESLNSLSESSDGNQPKKWKRMLGLKKVKSSENARLLKGKQSSSTPNGKTISNEWKKKFQRSKKDKDSEISSGLDEYAGDSESSTSVQQQEQQHTGKNKRAPSTKTDVGKWKSTFDPNSSKYYYYNTVTNETTWEQPETVHDDSSSSESEESAGTSSLELNTLPSNCDDSNQPNVIVEFDKDDVAMKKGKTQQVLDLLEQLSPGEDEANHKIAEEYIGREDELIIQLQELVEAQPFDEPSVGGGSITDSLTGGSKLVRSSNEHNERDDTVSPLASPVKIGRPKPSYMSGVSMNKRSYTASTGMLSRTSRMSKVSNTTQKISNTTKPFQRNNFNTSYQDAGSFSSLESHDNERALYNNPDRDLPRVDEIFEENFSSRPTKVPAKTEVVLGKGSNLRNSKKYRRAKSREILRSKSREGYRDDMQNLQESSTFEDGTYSADDSRSECSTISELSTPTTGLRDFDRGRAKVRLKRAIKNEDWDCASSVAKSLQGPDNGDPGQQSQHTMSPQEEWTQAQLEKNIEENRWDSVKRYVDDKGKANRENGDNLVSDLRKRMGVGKVKFGARSQLQHEDIARSRSYYSSSDDDNNIQEKRQFRTRRRS